MVKKLFYEMIELFGQLIVQIKIVEQLYWEFELRSQQKRCQINIGNRLDRLQLIVGIKGYKGESYYVIARNIGGKLTFRTFLGYI